MQQNGKRKLGERESTPWTSAAVKPDLAARDSSGGGGGGAFSKIFVRGGLQSQILKDPLVCYGLYANFLSWLDDSKLA